MESDLVKKLFSGDEILSVNGMSVQGMSHSEAISIFKNIKTGPVTMMVTRRDASHRRYNTEIVYKVIRIDKYSLLDGY